VLSRVRQILYPKLSDDEAFYRLGRGFIDRYDTTLMGKALLRMLPILGTRRVIGRLTQSFRTSPSVPSGSRASTGASSPPAWR